MRACILGQKQRKKSAKCDKNSATRLNRIEIMFGGLKDWPIVKNMGLRPSFLILLICCNPISDAPNTLPLSNRIGTTHHSLTMRRGYEAWL